MCVCAYIYCTRQPGQLGWPRLCVYGSLAEAPACDFNNIAVKSFSGGQLSHAFDISMYVWIEIDFHFTIQQYIQYLVTCA